MYPSQSAKQEQGGGGGKRRRVDPVPQATATLLEAAPRATLEQGTIPAHAPTPQQQVAKQAQAMLARLDEQNRVIHCMQRDKNFSRRNKNSRRRNGMSDENPYSYRKDKRPSKVVKRN